MQDEKLLELLNSEEANVLSLVSQLKAASESVLGSHYEEVEGLKQEIAGLKALTDGFIEPDYGMLPVTAQFHEAVVDLAQQRGTSPGLLMQTDAVHNHLMELIYKEII